MTVMMWVVPVVGVMLSQDSVSVLGYWSVLAVISVPMDSSTLEGTAVGRYVCHVSAQADLISVPSIPCLHLCQFSVRTSARCVLTIPVGVVKGGV